MNQIKCVNCNFLNDPNMNFCTNCGNDVFSRKQSSIPTVEKKLSEIQEVEQKNSLTKNTGSSKFWIGGLLGCFGLFGLGVIGIVLLGVITFSNKENELANTAQNANKSSPISNEKKKETVSSDNSETNSNSEVKTNKSASEGDNELIEILKDRQEAGKFKQLTANVVDVKDFFPFAKAAAQASYHNGSRYVSLSIGKFENFDDVKKNFDEQFANVKKKGGKTQILATSADGTINGVYQFKGTFSAEYCTKSAFCYRMASKDPKSLKYFIENFITL